MPLEQPIALLTTADLQTALKTSYAGGSVDYNQLDLLRRYVEKAVKRYCKWPLIANNGMGQGNFIEFYDGKNYQDIVLRQPFVADVINVWMDMQGNYGTSTNAFASTTVLTQGTDYSLVLEQPGKCKSGLLRRLSNSAYWWPSDAFYWNNPTGLSYQAPASWPIGWGNIKVAYDWGFNSVTSITSITWTGGVATVTMSQACVMWPTQEITITQDANWQGDYLIASVASNFLSFTMNTPNYGTFTAGNVDFVPMDIKEAICTAIGIIRNKVRLGYQLTSETLGDYNYSLSVQREPEFGDVRQLLSSYRDLSAGIAL